MGGREPRSALVIGSVSRDLIESADGPARARPGGTVVHAGITLARLGARVRVLTRVRDEDSSILLRPLDAEGAETLALPSRETTTFALDYSGPVDRHDLRSASDPLSALDLPPAWTRSELVQLGPLHRRDLAPGIVDALRGLIGIDVQGLLRERRPHGTTLGPNARLAEFLANVDVVKANEAELRVLLDGETAPRFAVRHGVSELLVTRGARGATVITGDDVLDVPAPPVSGTHTVGAGDVFLACYLLLRVEGRPPLQAARAAATLTAHRVEAGQLPTGTDWEDACESS